MGQIFKGESKSLNHQNPGIMAFMTSLNFLLSQALNLVCWREDFTLETFWISRVYPTGKTVPCARSVPPHGGPQTLVNLSSCHLCLFLLLLVNNPFGQYAEDSQRKPRHGRWSPVHTQPVCLGRGEQRQRTVVHFSTGATFPGQVSHQPLHLL